MYQITITQNFNGENKNYINLVTGNIFSENENNKDYQEYLTWISEGNEPIIIDARLNLDVTE